MITLERIVSGGQTGAARAALDFAMRHGIGHGGWCPRGRLAEDGPIPSRYALRETPLNTPFQCIERNVLDSDGTVVFSPGELAADGSSVVAGKLAQLYRKPWLHLSARQAEDAPERLARFVEANQIRVLHILGPGASSHPGIGPFVTGTLSRMREIPLVYLVQSQDLKACKDLLERSLRPRCVVRSFCDPQEALQVFAQTHCRPELLITGLVFDTLNGAELLIRCKELDPRLKAVLYAVFASPGMQELLDKEPLHPDAYVMKSMDLQRDGELLLAAVQALLPNPAGAAARETGNMTTHRPEPGRREDAYGNCSSR